VVYVADYVDLDIRWKRCGFVYAGVPRLATLRDVQKGEKEG